jgi:hypothetical protein
MAAAAEELEKEVMEGMGRLRSGRAYAYDDGVVAVAPPESRSLSSMAPLPLNWHHPHAY